MPKKFIKSFKFARAGAEHALKTQRNLWIHFFVGLTALALAVWLGIGPLELAILVVMIFGVIVTELVNTSIEELVNILSPQQRKEAELAKNVAAAAVLLAAIGAIIVGGLIFIPRLI
ncbi:MAG: diacylglycerol kinase family protein [Candidatus Margulisbacteria bacterium]|nr:diacylglycerol kinase family protein [Candidatus Margulisiibacteriota bacterium]